RFAPPEHFLTAVKREVGQEHRRDRTVAARAADRLDLIADQRREEIGLSTRLDQQMATEIVVLRAVTERFGDRPVIEALQLGERRQNIISLCHAPSIRLPE